MLKNMAILAATSVLAAFPAYAHHETGLATGALGVIIFAAVIAIGAGYGFNSRD